MSDIFVSYKKEDRATVERFVTALRAAGKEVWWDDALTPNEAWDAMIEKQIAAARVVIVLWSTRSIHSDWVRSEAHYAQDHHKIVPVMIEKCSIPLAFMLRQAVDLTDGKFGPGNPNWTKLLEWIDAVESGDVDAIPEGVAAPNVTAAAAVPLKAATGERWLGPASRPRLAAILATVAVVAAVFLFFLRGSLGFAQGAHPDVYVDPIVASKSGDIPADFAQSVNDEITAQLNSASRVTPLDSDGKRHIDAYQMSGNVRMANGKMTMFAKIFAPGIQAPVLSPRIEVPEDGVQAASKYLGGSAATILRCIATASDSSGSDILILPEKAIRPWAQFCESWINGGADFSKVTAQLEMVVKAAPDFANGWATLSEYRGIDATPASAVKAREAYERALEIDPDNPKATMLKALDVFGLQTNEPLRNFAEFERLATKANNTRPSDCGCEAKLYRDALILTGRFDAALPLLNRIIANDPGATYTMLLRAYVLDGLGRTSEAKRAVDDLNRAWPGSREGLSAGLTHALATGDWATAKKLAPKVDVFPGQAQAPALLDAIQAGNRAAIDGAVAPMIAGLDQIDSVSFPMIGLIAAAGKDRELAGGFAKAAAKYGAWGLTKAWAPQLKGARAQPEFIAVVKKYNLPAYWKQSGHRPDICLGQNDEPVCKLI
ncbi:MAG TPA: TIR domain-containing protein [Sphingomicrobium sp.]|nr:TIR domain-containing protein [Sphingomicrobium sp.]